MGTQSGIWSVKQVRDSKALAQYSTGVEISGLTGTIYSGNAVNLTITGINFGNAASVRFGYGASTTDVAVTPESDTQITVAVPSVVYNQPAGTTLSVAVLVSGQLSASQPITLQYLAPSGGTITTSGGYTIHTFTSSGTFASNSLATDVEYLVVGGGGASGGSSSRGGGGGGGFRTNVSGATSGGGASAEAALNVPRGTTYTVTVGAGGTVVQNTNPGQNGFSSVFGPITSLGGGGGAGGTGNTAASGGSGGGGTAFPSGSAGGAGTTGQGYAGGAGYSTSLSNSRAGGGGGAGAVGASGSVSANGGAGQVSSISGSAVYYAGGGGGGSENFARGLGGTGGGGNGAIYPDTTPAQNGTTNLGGGGGGGYVTGGSGGSGIVIVRYLTPT